MSCVAWEGAGSARRSGQRGVEPLSFDGGRSHFKSGPRGKVAGGAASRKTAFRRNIMVLCQLRCSNSGVCAAAHVQQGPPRPPHPPPFPLPLPPLQFEDFYIDMFDELSREGRLEWLVGADNLADHVVGNVYAR